MELNFIRGHSFSDETKQYIDFRGRKLVGGILLSQLEDIDMEVFGLLMKEALRVDEG